MIGVCSWSLRPATPADLARDATAAGVGAVQLALAPFRSRGRLRRPAWSLRRTTSLLEEAGLAVRSAMITTAGEDYATLASIRRTGGFRPDATWADNLAWVREASELAARLGVPLVTFHAGFLPHDRDDPERAVLIGRLATVVDVFAEAGVDVAFETGQETAATLLDVLAELDRPRAGVNFDPANMILYDMGDPVVALAALAPVVRQIHVKDARRTEVPGTWGEEVPVGAGEVDWPAFFAVVASEGLEVDLVIEREAGEQRVEDVARARRHVERLLAGRAS